MMQGRKPEVWAGVECTVNRVGDEYRNQLAFTGHLERVSDIDLLADLGVSAVRYPVLWEMVLPSGTGDPDWTWTDQRLADLGDAGISPIAGLLHHGSGPPTTDLLARDFPEQLAAYAGAVAARYPWVERYTPINEPLTTARFSALYGHWYPHQADDASFARALVNEVRGTMLAMQAIRRSCPDAQLIQTEDFGFTRSTPGLQYQADHENERRWLSFDLLVGRVTPDHRMWDWLRQSGISAKELLEMAARAETPAVLGLNYYMTSERYLDEAYERYPAWSHGGNGSDQYADVEAVRVRGCSLVGHEAVLRAAWERYQLPLAVTEVHIGAHRDEQLRWLWEAWNASTALRAEGIDVRAITPWAAFGSQDWDSLVVRLRGHYEPGLFDVRAPTPRPTALTHAVRALARDEEYWHPVLEQPGWWRRADRFFWGPEDDEGAGRE
jgi:dTDP-4-dehydrorhamnose reductase